MERLRERIEREKGVIEKYSATSRACVALENLGV